MSIKKSPSILIISFVVILLFTGCAAGYRPIRPNFISYRNTQLVDGISYSYLFDALSESGNRRYAKKAYKNRISILAVRITNNTPNAIDVNKDIYFKMGQREIYPIPSYTVTSNVKQGVWGYLGYSLIVLNLYSSNGYGVKTTVIPIGAAGALANMIVAGNSNSRFRNEFEMFNIDHKTIRANETLDGLVAFGDISNEPITIHLRKDSIAKSGNVNASTNSSQKQGASDINTIFIRTASDSILEDYFTRMSKELIEYYPNQIKVNIKRVDGKISSIGLLRFFPDYNNSSDVGPYFEFYPNGTLKEERNYNIDGFNHGNHIKYDEAGTIISQKTYANGFKSTE